jgi:hypothetical protein
MFRWSSGMITFGISLAAAVATFLSSDTKGKSLEDLETRL